MIDLKELRISEDGECLVIDFKVEDLDYYKDIYLSSIRIDTDETFNINGPSNKPIYEKEFEDIKVPGKDEYRGVKAKRLVLTKQELGDALKNNILFIYITVKGTPAPNTPCGKDNVTSLFTTAYMYPLYHDSVCLLKQVNNLCDIPKDLMQHILQLKSLELSIKAGNYTMAIQHWNFLRLKNKVITKCKCNG